MKISIELDDDAIIQFLTEFAESQLWHINNTINSICRQTGDGKDLTYLLMDLEESFNKFAEANNLLGYHGGKLVELRYVDVKFGHDIHGNPYK